MAKEVKEKKWLKLAKSGKRDYKLLKMAKQKGC